jgi:hypothetical protein
MCQKPDNNLSSFSREKTKEILLNLIHRSYHHRHPDEQHQKNKHHDLDHVVLCDAGAHYNTLKLGESNNKHKCLRMSNLPIHTDPEHLMDFLNFHLRETASCSSVYGKPDEQEKAPPSVLNCVVHDKVAFMCLSSTTAAESALKLNGIDYCGKKLDIRLPFKASSSRFLPSHNIRSAQAIINH